MQRIKENTSYYINERAVNLVENALGDPSLIQVSLYSGTVVLVYIKGIIDYAYDGGYQRFPLYGYNTALISNEAHHIYIRIERSRGTAMLLFSTQEYEFDSDESGQYWYIRCGEVTSAGSGSTPREITFDSGLLSTAEGLEGMLDGRYVSVSYFERIFDVLNGSTSVRTNDLNTVFDSLKVKTGLWTEQYVSALGKNSGGSGGGGGGGLDRQTLFDSILKRTPATGEYINPAFLPIDGTSIYIQNGVLKSRGTISSVGLYVPNGSGLVVTGSPLTSNGTINLSVASGYVIPTTSRMSAIESSIADLDQRVDALEDMFGIDGNGNIYVKNNRGFYSYSFVSALGSNSGSGGGGGLDRQTLFDSILKSTPATGEYINSRFLKLGTGLTIDGNGNIKVDGVSVTWSSIQGTPPFYTKQESDSLFVKVSFFNKLFAAFNGTTAVATNDVNATIDNIKSLVGFWTNEYISALGRNSNASPTGINEQELWNILGTASAHTIDVSHIPSLSAYALANHTHTFADLTTHPTTLSGYGITNAYTKTEVDDKLNLYLSKAFFNKIFKAHNGNNDVLPSNPTADASVNITDIEAMFGFWTKEYISALGRNAGAPTLTLAGLSDVNVQGAQNGQALVYNAATGKWIPGVVSGGSSAWADITGKPTTLSGYGITDAYINSSGTIVLGSSSITPVKTTGTQSVQGEKTFLDNMHIGNSSSSFKRIFFGDNQYVWIGEYADDKLKIYSDKGIDLANSSGAVSVNGNTILHAGNYSSYITDTDTTYKLTLNGTTNGSSSGVSLGSFYAPTGAGTNGYVLKSSGSGAPSWVAQSTLSVGSAATATTATTASKVIDSYNTSKEITITYAKDGQSSTSWLASWNGYELGSISPSNITAGAAIKDGAGNTITSKYVTLDTPQIISGSKTFTSTIKLSGCGIEDVGGFGLLVYKPSSDWTGISSSQWGVGSANCQGVIRSNNNPLVHYKDGTNYNILDASGGSLVGHLYFDGANPNSSIGNTSQIIFRTSGGTQQVAISCNSNALIINPTSSATTGQVVLGVNGSTSYFNSTGNFGIGTDSPSSKLTVAGTITPSATKTYDVGSQSLCWRWVYAQWVGSPTGETFGIGANDQRHLHIATNGYIGIGMGSNTPSQRLHVSGNILATGGITALSDMRYKSKISDVNTRVEDIANLPVIYFKWKAGEDDDMHIGTSAQAVQKLFPELVLSKAELSVNYGVLGTTIGILNSRKLTEHEKEIMALKKENKALKERIKVLEDRA